MSRLDLDHFLPYRISIASNAMSERIAADYRGRFGLSIAEWRVMAILGDRGAHSQRQLTHATRMDKVTVSRAARALVERGLLVRAPNAEDARSHALSLSEEGRALYDQIVPAALAMEQRFLAVVSDEEYRLLMDLLVRLRDRADSLGL